MTSSGIEPATLQLEYRNKIAISDISLALVKASLLEA
jgi:hypothetical protein